MISIVVPTLNEEKLLDRMLGQFTTELRVQYNLQIVVSDGGSTDRTLEIARERQCLLLENVGHVKQTISLGRNIGARSAHGDVLIFLNADTLIKDIDHFFHRITQELQMQDAVALTCSVGVYPEEERLSDRLFHGFYNWLFALMNVVGMGMGRGECHIIPRAVFDRAGGYSARIAAGEDYDMFRRLKDFGRIRFLKDVKVYESPRRYRRYGYFYVSASWFLNFISVFFLRRSILDEWKPVR